MSMREAARGAAVAVLLVISLVATAVQAETLAPKLGTPMTPADVLAAPYALVGTVEEIADEVLAHQERWGFSSYVVREPAVEAIAAVIARLAR